MSVTVLRRRETSPERVTLKNLKNKIIAMLVAVLLLSGCPALLSALAVVAQASQYVGSLVSVADAGQEAYFARHPNQEAQERVSKALRVAHQALAVLDGMTATATDASAKDLALAKRDVVAAYADLLVLLTELGVIDAKAGGGAETTAPKPDPVLLPPADRVASLFGVATWDEKR